MRHDRFDVLIRGGTVATATEVFKADVGIKGEEIFAIGHDLGRGDREIDANGMLVLPGGVDPHVHIEQVSANGILNADSWESGTTAAAFGGTTTVIAFAAQHVGMSLARVVEDYSALARKGAIIDYCFHMILADPTEEALTLDLPKLIREGHSSIKLFMTYDRLRVSDESILDVLLVAKETGASVCFHAESSGMISWMSKHLLAAGFSQPVYHPLSHPRLAEADAIDRLVKLSALVDHPIIIFHVSTAEGAAIIRRARGDNLKIFGETCPQYLFMDAGDLQKPGLEAAKWMCSPPPRTVDDQEALWNALDRGDLQLVSSDHAPYRFDTGGKLRNGDKSNFKEIANGIPGIEARLPLLFDAMVSKGRLGLDKFVELTSTAPAKLFNLHPRKGSIAIGADADIVVWDAERRVTLTDETMHDRTGYTPYRGREVQGWPQIVLRRGKVIIQDGERHDEPGSGRFVTRSRMPESTGWLASHVAQHMASLK
ncbi:dihydropyrimidinase [Mesorhizobium wenxiniae]|uniref:D-hydantoinase n=1 Tax=Mesorhizobium wenxiniae TaxID=2014805 RepID=A0A271KAI8_9HYPH|nr:dihydropyrimidinase [Mesorhizobium wenxiniae]PAP92065.1 dihydropyrimidinase [Mesorhizobium wenxiniae]